MKMIDVIVKLGLGFFFAITGLVIIIVACAFLDGYILPIIEYGLFGTDKCDYVRIFPLFGEPVHGAFICNE